MKTSKQTPSGTLLVGGCPSLITPPAESSAEPGTAVQRQLPLGNGRPALSPAPLEETPTLLRTILDAIPTRVFWKDCNSVYVGCNRRFVQDAGCDSPSQVVGKTDFDFPWRAHAERYQREDRAVIDSGFSRLNCEELQSWEGGRQVWLSVSRLPWREAGGGALGVLGLYEDITARKRAAERVREQAALLDIAHDAIAVLDLEGRVIYWNYASEKLYGWPVEEALGRSAGRLFFESLSPEFVQGFAAVLKHGHWSGELCQTHREGRRVVVQSRATLVRDAAGQPQSILLVSTDVTDRKALEAKFLRAQRLEVIGALASGIAHDLNNVLAPVSMAVDMLRLRLRGEDEQMLLQILAGSAQRGAGIVRQLLTFGRGLEPMRGRLRPKVLLREVAKIIEETFPKSIRLKVDFAEDLWDLVGDPTQLHQVLLNLCINARDAMPQGGVLTLGARNVRLDRAVASPGGAEHSGPHVVIEVTDSGTGMSPEVLGKIFVPFFTTKPVGQGTGLGLATVRDIAQGHGGFVEVSSEPSKGTRFSVYFPSSELQPPALAQNPSTPVPSGNGELVLVADDEQSVVKLAKHTLESHGYRVLTASDGEEALDMFSRNAATVRAVVIDLMMPNLGGEETIESLRARHPGLPIIAISGSLPGLPETRTNRSQPLVTLHKPFTVAQLLEALHSALASKG